MSVYKFLHSRHLNSVLDEGSVRIGSLSHYRKLESEQWIADRLEGRIKLDAGGIVVTEDDNKLDSILPPSLAGRHVHVESGGRVMFAPGVRITIEHPEVFVFSASRGDLESLTKSMCRGANPYDACFRIEDIDLLAHRLLHRGRIVELGNVKASEKFFRVECREVAYDSLSRAPAMGPSPEASPFLKDNHFSEQHEIRIVLWPKETIATPTLTIHTPHPKRFFEEVFRNSGPKLVTRNSK